jgi:methionyl aminopeptidase
MLTAGSPATIELEDGWTVVTEDGKAAAHYEHTILITQEGAEILTRLPD